jgi:hypothetical protein
MSSEFTEEDIARVVRPAVRAADARTTGAREKTLRRKVTNHHSPNPADLAPGESYARSCQSAARAESAFSCVFFLLLPAFETLEDTRSGEGFSQRPHIETRDLRAGQDASQSATLDEPSVDTRSTARAQRARRRSPEGASTTRSSPSRVVAIAFEAADRFFV